MKCEQFTDLQRLSFDFRLSFGESHGSSVSDQARPNLEAIIAYEQRSPGDPYPNEPGPTLLILR